MNKRLAEFLPNFQVVWRSELQVYLYHRLRCSAASIAEGQTATLITFVVVTLPVLRAAVDRRFFLSFCGVNNCLYGGTHSLFKCFKDFVWNRSTGITKDLRENPLKVLNVVLEKIEKNKMVGYGKI